MYRPGSAGGDVDDAVETDVVVRIHDHFEVGDDVLDFLAAIELGAAGDLVGDGLLHEGVFQHAGKGVDAVEDGEFVPGEAVVVVSFLETADDFGGFLVFVVGAEGS